MDPQEEFKKRYNAYITQRSSQVTPSTPAAPPKSKKFSPNKFYFLGIIVGLLIVTPVASYLFLANRLATPSSKTASTDLVAKNQPTEQEITQEMQKVWGSYYEQAKNDPKLRASAKRNIMLRFAAVKAGVTNSSIASNEDATYSQIQNETITQLEKKVVNSRTVDFVSVFKNPLSSDYEKNKTSAVSTFNEIKTLVDEGKSLEEAYGEVKSSTGFDRDIKLFQDEYVTGDSNWNSLFKDALFALKEGETTEVLVSPGGSIILAQVKSATDTQYENVNEYLNTVK